MHDNFCRCRTCKPSLVPLIAEQPGEMTFGQYLLIYAAIVAVFCGGLYFATV